MVKRTDTDENYVLDLCDEVLGVNGRRRARFDGLRGDPSPSHPSGSMLPVDGYWPVFQLIVELQEEQHSIPSPFFDRRHTVSGLGRGDERRLYDERTRRLVPTRGFRLVLIEKSSFIVKSARIRRDRSRDIVTVGEHLES